MDKLNPRTNAALWKIGSMTVGFFVVTSFLSRKAFESDRLPRKHLLMFSELLRSAASHSIRASQDTHPATVFEDATRAHIALEIVSDFLTPTQVRSLTEVDIDEMKEFVGKQQQTAYTNLLRKVDA